MDLAINIHQPLRNFALNINFKCFSNTGIFGPSGAGKSTLLKTICGLNTKATGKIIYNKKVFLDSENKKFLPPWQRNIGVVFQEDRLFPHMNIRENLLFPLKAKKRSFNSSINKITDILKLSHLLNCSPCELSGGERQRVALGRALIAEPELLLLDEPFSAADNSNKKEMISFIRESCHNLNIPAMIISHDLNDLTSLTDNVLSISKGELSSVLSSKQLLIKKILHDSTFKAINTWQMKVLSLKNGLAKMEGKNKFTIYGIANDELERNNMITAMLPATEIIIARGPDFPVSARNCIKSRIVSIDASDNSMLVEGFCGEKIFAEISAKAGREMKLKIGESVTFIFKSSNILFK